MADSDSTSSSSSNGEDKEKKTHTPAARRVASLRNPTEFVTFYCGQSPDAKPFVLHKDFAVHYSPALKAAFASAFVEGQTQTYRFEDTTEEAIRLLVHWMYTQQLDTERDMEKLKERGPNGANVTQNTALFQLWVLADKMLIPRLQNMVMDKIDELARYTRLTPTSHVRYTWKNTQYGSPLRAWYLKEYAYEFKRKYLDEVKLRKRCPSEMLAELAVLLLQSMPDSARQKEKTERRDVSKYHVAIPDGE